MKDAIQNNGEELSIVIYDAPLPPRYLKFSKKFIRTLFIVTPVTLGLVLLALVGLIITPSVKNAPGPKIPSVISADDSKLGELEAELKSLQLSHKQLQDKLSSQKSSDSTQDDIYLMGILKPYGMQNLLNDKKVTLDQFEFLTAGDKTNLKFQIISTTPENRVAGHVIVFMISKSGVTAYPETAANSLSQGIKFSMGEPFAVSRLRPTNAEFSSRPWGDSVKFVVYIFSREGDLLLIKETDPYPIQGK
jgi:hypothetical protein